MTRVAIALAGMSPSSETSLEHRMDTGFGVKNFNDSTDIIKSGLLVRLIPSNCLLIIPFKESR